MEVSTATASAVSRETAVATQSLAQNFEDFLLMLTTQLQYQDPLNPTDATQFTNQLVQFSQLEQQISQSSKIEDLIALQLSAERMGAVNLLGKTVEVQSDLTLLEDGNATISYHMPEGAVNAKVAILDSDGNFVTSFSISTEPGRHEVEWGGKDNQNVTRADGPYTVVVSAVNTDDQPFKDIPVFFSGTADAVWQSEGQTFVTVGPLEIPLDRILTIKTPQTTPTV